MRYAKYKETKDKFKKICSTPSKYLIVHYSCESFYDITNGRTPRITSIAVRYLETGQTNSFSIHKIAEKHQYSNSDIDNHYDILEKEMLQEFFDFVSLHSNYFWIHLNMRDINYGFQAIEHRYSVLGGTPKIICDDKKIDFARLLRNYYGERYIDHPRFQKLVEYNAMTTTNFLQGSQEAEAFEKKEYIKLHQSTLRKVDLMQVVIEKVCDNTLKTKGKWYDIYDFTPQGLFELTKDNWLVATIFSVVSFLIGFYVK